MDDYGILENLAWGLVRDWRRLKRLFGIEIDGCARCGGKVKIIASIEDPLVIAKILSPLERTAPQQYPTELGFGARVPPVQSSLL